MEILTIETKSLGDRSYLVIDGTKAAVVDPQRDIDRVLAELEDRELELIIVLETHLHNDYVTGGFELAGRTGVTYVLPGGDEVDFDHVGAADGDEYPVGDSVVLRAVHTPGHTPHHMSYVVVDGGKPVAVFTGGSLLYGTVGRTDLISDDATDALTRAQYRSARRLAAELPGEVSVHPTHGFGSFCSAASSSGSDSSTIAQEQRTNIALTTGDEEDFVETLLSGLTAYPRYYAHMAAKNRQGPAPIDLSPPAPVDPVELRRRIHAGEWVVDLRDRRAFAQSHLAGTINVEIGDSFVTYLGWTIRWGTPVTLVGDTAEEVADAQRQLARIGIDRPAGAAAGGLETWAAGGDLRSYRSATFADLAVELNHGGLSVLDVRRHDEWHAGHFDGALHVPLDQLEDRMDEVPTDGPVWVHCASGFRASIAASLVARAGREVVAIHDEWDEASEHGTLVVTR
ncbi:MAG: MBL fold metallo-hydrolase [Microthrixaceae bacterium]|nr:MBL fold metallo-hydrolase [Microthrixaceae bacterium]MCB0989042.1 MBL fold metallo-hydrolase [Acidimicrobiales bacterium]